MKKKNIYIYLKFRLTFFVVNEMKKRPAEACRHSQTNSVRIDLKSEKRLVSYPHSLN